MLDRYALALVRKPVAAGASLLAHLGISADQVTVMGFMVGLCCLPFFAAQKYIAALVCILINRICDGLDGALARHTSKSDAGAFLDIVLDFIFYGATVLGFALADPGRNSLAASFLLCTFVATGSTFLGFAILAERRQLHSIVYPSKGLYYLGGLTEGTETIAFFVVSCLFPGYFPAIALIFGSLCIVTAITRVISGYLLLKRKL